jgi:hypothetical protein
MKFFLLSTIFVCFFFTAHSQTTWQVCIEEPDASTCSGKTGTFTPGNLVIQQGDMIQFTTTMVLLGGYTGTNHDIQFTGSPANNVTLLVSSDIFNQVTTVTTPPFNTIGTFPMECVDWAHCLLAQYSCTGYSVEVQAACSITASFTGSSLSICEGELVNFTDGSTGATNYDWKIDETQFATTTNSDYTFNSAGNFQIELVVDDGSGCKDSMEVTVDVTEAVDAGSDNTANVCNIGGTLDLNTLLDGDTGGSWNETTSSGQFTTGTGVLDYTGLTPGNYIFEYTMTGTSPCTDDVATITITVNQSPDLILNLSTTNLDLSDSVNIDFTTSGIQSGATYLWSFCDGNNASNSSPFYYSWSSVGSSYCVCVDVDNQNGCVETFCENGITVFDASRIIEESGLKLDVYPNPASDYFTVDLSNINGEVSISLIDQLQREVYSQKTAGGNLIEINSNTFENGLYYIQIKTNGQKAIIPIVFR